MAIRRQAHQLTSEELPREEDSAELRRLEESLPDIERHHTRGLLRTRVAVRNDGTISIPAELREILALAPGKTVEMEITTGGCLLIRPPDDVDPEQWMWRTRQLRVDDLSAERGRLYLSDEEFEAALSDPGH